MNFNSLPNMSGRRACKFVKVKSFKVIQRTRQVSSLLPNPALSMKAQAVTMRLCQPRFFPGLLMTNYRFFRASYMIRQHFDCMPCKRPSKVLRVKTLQCAYSSSRMWIYICICGLNSICSQHLDSRIRALICSFDLD